MRHVAQFVLVAPHPRLQVGRTSAYPRDAVFLEAAAQDDWVGVQAYTRTTIGPDGPRPVAADAETTLNGWEYYPAALEGGRPARGPLHSGRAGVDQRERRRHR